MFRESELQLNDPGSIPVTGFSVKLCVLLPQYWLISELRR